MDMEKLYWALLTRVPGLGARKFMQLIQSFGSAESVWTATQPELIKVLGEGKIYINLLALRQKMDVQQVQKEISSANIEIVTRNEPQYPTSLKQIYDPPPVLFVQGRITDQPKIAIVGSRNCSAYGRTVVQKIGAELAQHGFCVVSGMARGIDTSAHQGALQHGSTIAVLGCGLDRCYPPENKKLKEQIALNGAVISEFVPGTPPLPMNFPARNRIISGLSKAVVVVEAGEKSGALITVDYALEQGKDVYAVPGSILTPYSKGCHVILKQGAKLVDSIDDILQDISEAKPRMGNLFDSLPELNTKEQDVYNFIAGGAQDLEELTGKASMPIGELTYLLLQLELKGCVKQLPGSRYMPMYGR